MSSSMLSASALFALKAFSAFLITLAALVIVTLIVWLVTRTSALQRGRGGEKAYDGQITTLYALSAANSLGDFLTIVAVSALGSVRSVYSFVVANWQLVVTLVILSGAGLALTSVHQPVLEGSTTVYNRFISPLFQFVVLPVLNVARLAYSAVICVWNFLFLMGQYMVFGLPKTIAVCQVNNLGPFFDALGQMIVAAFDSFTTWVNGDPLFDRWDLTDTAAAFGDAVVTLQDTLTCACSDLCILWKALLTPYQSENLGVAVTAAWNTPLSLALEVPRAVVLLDRVNFNVTFTYAVDAVYYSFFFLDDVWQTFFNVLVVGADYTQGTVIEGLDLPPVLTILAPPFVFPVRAANYTVNFVLNIDQTWKTDGIRFFDVTPFIEDGLIFIDTVCDIFRFFADVGIRVSGIFFNVPDAVEDTIQGLIVNLCDVIRYYFRALLFTAQFLIEIVMGQLYDFLQLNPLGQSFWTAVDEGSFQLVFANLRVGNQRLACVINVLYEPLGYSTQFILNLIVDLVLIALETVSLFLQLLAQGTPMPPTVVFPMASTFLIQDMRGFARSFGDYSRIMAPGCIESAYPTPQCMNCTVNDIESPACFATAGYQELCCSGDNEFNFFCALTPIVEAAIETVVNLFEQIIVSIDAITPGSPLFGQDVDVLFSLRTTLDSATDVLSNATAIIVSSAAGRTPTAANQCMLTGANDVIFAFLNVTVSPFWLIENAIVVANRADQTTPINSFSDFIVGFIRLVSDPVIGILRALQVLTGCGSTTVSNFFGLLADAVEVTTEFVTTVFLDLFLLIVQFFTSLFSGDFAMLGDALIGILNVFVQTITVVWQQFLDWFLTNVLQKLITTIQNVINGVVNIVNSFCEAAVSGFNTLISAVNSVSEAVGLGPLLGTFQAPCPDPIVINFSFTKRQAPMFVNETESSMIDYTNMTRFPSSVYNLVKNISDGFDSHLMNTHTRCMMILTAYRNYTWESLTPLEQIEYLDCIETLTVSLEMRKINGFQNLPLDIMWSRWRWLEYLATAIRGLSVYYSYQHEISLTESALYSPEYTALCESKNISIAHLYNSSSMGAPIEELLGNYTVEQALRENGCDVELTLALVGWVRNFTTNLWSFVSFKYDVGRLLTNYYMSFDEERRVNDTSVRLLGGLGTTATNLQRFWNTHNVSGLAYNVTLLVKSGNYSLFTDEYGNSLLTGDAFTDPSPSNTTSPGNNTEEASGGGEAFAKRAAPSLVEVLGEKFAPRTESAKYLRQALRARWQAAVAAISGEREVSADEWDEMALDEFVTSPATHYDDEDEEDENGEEGEAIDMHALMYAFYEEYYYTSLFNSTQRLPRTREAATGRRRVARGDHTADRRVLHEYKEKRRYRNLPRRTGRYATREEMEVARAHRMDEALYLQLQQSMPTFEDRVLQRRQLAGGAGINLTEGCPAVFSDAVVTTKVFQIGCLVLDEFVTLGLNLSFYCVDYYQNGFLDSVASFVDYFNRTFASNPDGFDPFGTAGFMDGGLDGPLRLQQYTTKQHTHGRRNGGDTLRLPLKNFPFIQTWAGQALMESVFPFVELYSPIEVAAFTPTNSSQQTQSPGGLFGTVNWNQWVLNLFTDVGLTIVQFFEDIYAFFTNGNPNDQSGLLYWFNFFTTCDSTYLDDVGGVGLTNGILIGFVFLTLYTLIAAYFIPLLWTYWPVGLIVSLEIVLIAGYGWNPVWCQAALPVKLGDDLFDLSTDIFPPCIPWEADFPLDNGTARCTNDLCWCDQELPDCTSQVNDDGLGFKDFIDNTLYLANLVSPGYLQTQLDASVSYLVILFGRPRVQLWATALANGTEPARARVCFAVTSGNFLVPGWLLVGGAALVWIILPIIWAFGISFLTFIFSAAGLTFNIAAQIQGGAIDNWDGQQDAYENSESYEEVHDDTNPNSRQTMIETSASSGWGNGGTLRRRTNINSEPQ